MASDLFNYKNVKNNVHRSSFDLGNVHSFTAKAGELLPVYTKITMPGDKFQLKTSHFTRTRPLQSASYGRIKEYFDWFFVPMRLLWKDFPATATLMTDNPTSAKDFVNSKDITEDMPYFRLSDVFSWTNQNHNTYANGVLGAFDDYGGDYELAKASALRNNVGFDRFEQTKKLFQYLGYGTFNKTYDDTKNHTFINWYANDVAVNPFPLLAYQKIYQDYYRNENWEVSQPFAYNVDYMTKGGLIPVPDQDQLNWRTPSMFDLRYCNYEKDLYFGILPTSQYGAVSEVIGSVKGRLGYANPNEHAYIVPDNSGLDAGEINKLQSSFNILQLRQSQYLQKWKEIAESGNHDYKDQIYKHFGVVIADELSNLCKFIGGSSNFIDINEVVNTALNDPNSKANMAANGVGSSQGSEYFECTEHGVLMCVYHALPIMSYGTSGIDKALLKTTAYDYAIPEFDSIGMEVLPEICVANIKDINSLTNLNDVHGFGYVPRYVDYKTSVDRVSGDFLGTSKDWVQQFTDDDLHNSAFVGLMKVHPQVLDKIFGVNVNSDVSTDQFLVNANFDVKAVRNLDYNGLPY